ncbi:MAG TPA: hypothetical protein DCQ92_18640 [Verrucomicrobia subdivision 3 bacterium]|nr:hypothetical protein [Limisphaerales bacterium]
MKQQTKLSQKQEHITEQQTQSQAAKEFSNADELLRFDAAQTAVPPEIAERLKKSAEKIQPPEARSWWKNLLGH